MSLVINYSVKYKNHAIFSETQHFVKHYGFLSFAKNMGRKLVKI